MADDKLKDAYQQGKNRLDEIRAKDTELYKRIIYNFYSRDEIAKRLKEVTRDEISQGFIRMSITEDPNWTVLPSPASINQELFFELLNEELKGVEFQITSDFVLGVGYSVNYLGYPHFVVSLAQFE